MRLNLEDAASDSDIEFLYRFFLRREIEEGAVGGLSGTPISVGLRSMLLSPEFTAALIDPLRQGLLPSVASIPPQNEVLLWASRRLPVGQGAVESLTRAETWLEAYAAFLGDPSVEGLLADDNYLADPRLRAALLEATQLQGGVFGVDGRSLHGWAFHASRTPVRIEVWFDGAFVAAAHANRFHRTMLERFGGRGEHAFQIDLPVDMAGRRGRLKIVAAGTGIAFADIEIDLPTLPETSAFRALHRELAELKTMMRSLEKRLPVALNDLTMPVDDYAAYYETWRSTVWPDELPDADRIRIAVLIDAGDAPAPWIEDAVWSVSRQTHRNLEIIVGGGGSNVEYLQDLAQRVKARTDLDITIVTSTTAAPWRSLAPIDADVDVVQLLTADVVLHPESLRLVADAFAKESQIEAVYFDEDDFSGDDADSFLSREHVNPVLKPKFDADYLSQYPYIGALLAFRRTAWERLPQEARRGGLWPCAALLSQEVQPEQVWHIALVLGTRRVEARLNEARDWVGIMREYFGEAVEAHTDILGAKVDHAARIRRRPPEGATATVIIPTKDRLDLLQPCLQSLISNRGANTTKMRIVLLDHQSADAAAIDYMRNLQLSGEVEIRAYQGDFNWALMNNLAANESPDDVLIFLNNDTVVISPDWLDVMTAEAVRPGVGAVGCRLIYADGAIQHAGFLARDSEANFLTHDGVGDASASAGYLGRYALAHRTVAVTGACMAVRRDVFVAVGGFDAARLPVEGNDVDFCFRAETAGFQTLYTPYATLYHLESRTRTWDRDEDKASANIAARTLWRRWGEAVCPDPWFNAHFDRLGRPFQKLRPVDGTNQERTQARKTTLAT